MAIVDNDYLKCVSFTLIYFNLVFNNIWTVGCVYANQPI